MRRIAVCGFLCAFGGVTSACDAGKAGFAVGEPFSAELAERARVAAEATSVRRIVKGLAYTMEFLDSRLNLHTDEGGRVSRVSCG
ncbi:MAG TPA: I78 family peptidase inhibitor [Rhodoblastus sp.]|nr:I78 family peptidase inhibitor [Rhodoblastus sp.]